MTVTREMEAVALPDFNASWSNRNGGELLLTGGSMRLVVSAAWAQALVEKITRALDVPKRAAVMASRDPAPDVERISDPEATISEPLSDRRYALIRKVPHSATRLSAVREARAAIAIEGGVAACIAGILFTDGELAGIEVTLDDALMAAALDAAVRD